MPRRNRQQIERESIQCLAEADEEGQQDGQQEAAEAAVKTEYHVCIHTSSCRGAGTQGRVSIELHGQGGSSGLQPLHPANDDAFARSQVTYMHVSLLTHILPQAAHQRCMSGPYGTAHSRTLDILRLAVRARHSRYIMCKFNHAHLSLTWAAQCDIWLPLDTERRSFFTSFSLSLMLVMGNCNHAICCVHDAQWQSH